MRLFFKLSLEEHSFLLGSLVLEAFNLSVPILTWGAQNEKQYSSCNQTSEKPSGMTVLCDFNRTILVIQSGFFFLILAIVSNNWVYYGQAKPSYLFHCCQITSPHFVFRHFSF